jgi:ATP-binding cassette subfamily C protein
VIRLPDLRPFAGGRTIFCLVASIFVGLALFGVEVGFAYGLQAFLLLLGVAAPGTLRLPAWVPQARTGPVLAVVFLLTLLRSLLLWAQLYLRDAGGEIFTSLQRSRVLRWAFYSPGPGSSQVTSLFGERAAQAGSWVRQLQAALNLGTLCALILAALFYLQPYVTVAAAAMLAVLLMPLRRVNRRIRQSGRGLLAEWDRTYGRLVLSVRNLLLLRIYGLEEAEERQAAAGIGSHLRHYLTFQRTSGLILVIPQTIGVTLICMLLLLARARIHLSTGVLLLYFYLLVRLLQNSAPLGQASANAVFLWPQVTALYTWWQTEYLPSGAADARPAGSHALVPLAVPTAVGWRCEQVGFTYPGAARPVLRDLTFEIAPGSAVVINGPSGAGKSTLLNLLLAQLTPLAGTIDLIAGDARMRLAEGKTQLMPLVGYVGAESFLVDGTIRENLLYGVHRTPGEAELAVALGKAECGFIDELPGRLEHRLTEQGAGLSSGQKQRLSLARALLRRPGVLVLDEATANLDAATEERLVDTLTELKGGMTIVAVTHRPALLRLADQVLTLEP